MPLVLPVVRNQNQNALRKTASDIVDGLAPVQVVKAGNKRLSSSSSRSDGCITARTSATRRRIPPERLRTGMRQLAHQDQDEQDYAEFLRAKRRAGRTRRTFLNGAAALNQTVVLKNGAVSSPGKSMISPSSGKQDPKRCCERGFAQRMAHKKVGEAVGQRDD